MATPQNRGELVRQFVLTPKWYPHIIIPLSSYHVNIVGRRTISTLGIHSDINPKKVNVSRNQIELRVQPTSVQLKMIGLNQSSFTPRFGATHAISKNDVIVMRVGDEFSLLTSAFAFVLEEQVVPIEKEFRFKAPEGTSHIIGVIPTDYFGLRVTVLDGQSWRPGKVLAHDPATEHYKVALDSGRVIWEGLYQMRLYTQQQKLVGGPHSHMGKRASAYDSSDDNDDVKKMSQIKKKSRNNGSGNGTLVRKESRTDRVTRARRNVNYTEWISSSDEEDYSSGDNNGNSNGNSNVVDKPIRRKAGGTLLKTDQVSARPTWIFFSAMCMKHFVPKWHLEKPERLSAIMSGLREFAEVYKETVRIIEDVKPVSMEILLRTHEKDYIDRIQKICPDSDMPEHVTQYTQDTDDRESEDFDTFMSRDSMSAALIACGAVCAAIDQVASGNIRNAFCAIRPPGHHCGVKGHTSGANSQGYCIINNIAVGALYARAKHNFHRIAVIDFDVHHGNGTEEILGDRAGFLFASIHVGEIYPRTGQDGVPRKPNIVNVCMNPGDDGSKFHEAFDKHIIPELKLFKPDLLMLSAGFDAHKRDPTEDGMKLEEKDYFILTEKLKAIADEFSNGRIVSVLEGGYHLPSLRRCVREHLTSLIKK